MPKTGVGAVNCPASAGFLIWGTCHHPFAPLNGGGLMSSSTDFRPVIDMLFEAWKYRRAAIDAGDMASWAKWDEAIDALLDRWLIERLDLRWQGDPLG